MIAPLSSNQPNFLTDGPIASDRPMIIISDVMMQMHSVFT